VLPSPPKSLESEPYGSFEDGERGDRKDDFAPLLTPRSLFDLASILAGLRSPRLLKNT
jgi:hypothetical protein